MITIEVDSDYQNLTCPICHSHLRPGDQVLVSYPGGDLRAMHAHLCQSPRAKTA
jgi:ferredoxin-NADP reductase